jgi:hypothetical protein
MVESALFCDVDHFLTRIAQQGHRLQQAYFHSQGGNGKAEMLVKQTVQMPAAATEFRRQLVHRKLQQFGRRQLFKNLDHVVFRPAKAAALRMHALELITQNGRHDPEQLASLLETGLGISAFQERLAFHGHVAARHENLSRLEIGHDIVQQPNFIAGKQREQMLKQQGIRREYALALLVRV